MPTKLYSKKGKRLFFNLNFVKFFGLFNYVLHWSFTKNNFTHLKLRSYYISRSSLKSYVRIKPIRSLEKVGYDQFIDFI